MRTIKLMITILFLLFMANVAAAETAATSPAANAQQTATFYTENKTAIIVTADHPEFVVKLQSNRSTGYSWFLRAYDTNFIKPVKHVYEAAANKKLMGAPGYEWWTFHVKPAAFAVPMQTLIRFVYARPWEADQQAKQIVFSVSTNKH